MFSLLSILLYIIGHELSGSVSGVGPHRHRTTQYSRILRCENVIEILCEVLYADVSDGSWHIWTVLAWGIYMECMKYDLKRACALQTSFYLLGGDAKTLRLHYRDFGYPNSNQKCSAQTVKSSLHEIPRPG